MNFFNEPLNPKTPNFQNEDLELFSGFIILKGNFENVLVIQVADFTRHHENNILTCLRLYL